MNRYEQKRFEQYQKSEMKSLKDAYEKFSAKKQEIWNECEALMKACHGTGLRILTRNCRVFTVGFVYTDYFGRECFAIITPSKSVCCYIE